VLLELVAQGQAIGKQPALCQFQNATLASAVAGLSMLTTTAQPQVSVKTTPAAQPSI
jgi:hypothetical protein